MSVLASLKKDLDPEFLSTEDGRFLQMSHSMYERELDLQNESLRQKAIDCDFYDGDQLNEAEKNIYDLRSQDPKVYNHIKPTVDWLLGSERRTRSDWNILPRSEDDVKSALVKTKLVKYVEDLNNARFARSSAFADMVKSGEGWMRIGLDRDSEGDLRVSVKHEHWRNMLRDSTGRRQDLEDCKTVWCSKPVDFDDLVTAFPKKSDELQREIQDYDDIKIEIDDQISTDHHTSSQRDSSWVVQRKGSMSLDHFAGQFISQRKAVRVWEMWYRKTERVDVLNKAGKLNGEIFDKANPEHVAAVQAGARVVNVLRKSMWCAMYTRSVVLYNKRSPYKHNKFPFVARFGYVKDKDGWTYGIIRQIRDPQKDLNSRKNKALWLMSVCQVIMEKGAVKDVNRLAEQIAKPDGIIELDMPTKKFEIVRGADLANQQLNVANQDALNIQEVSGVTGQNRGTDGIAKSGIAIQSLQEQGSVITTPLIDNHIGAHQAEGEIVLSLCEQFIDYEMQFRITGDNNKPDFVSLNNPNDPTTNINDTKADFIVARKDYRDTFRQGMSEMLFNIAGAITSATGDPRLSLGIIEMAVDLQDIPEKQSITENLRNLLNMPKRNETEEEKAKREAQEQAAMQAKQQYDDKLRGLDLAEREIQIAVKQAEAKERLAEAMREESNALSHKADAVQKIYSAAATIANNPSLSPYADDLIKNIDRVLLTGKIDEQAIRMLDGISATTGGQPQPEAQGQPPQEQVPPETQPTT